MHRTKEIKTSLYQGAEYDCRVLYWIKTSHLLFLHAICLANIPIVNQKEVQVPPSQAENSHETKQEQAVNLSTAGAHHALT